MEYNLSANFWTLRLDLQGGRIIELKYRGETILGDFDRIDGKKGSTHLCLPNFGAEGQDKYGLPFHGPARSVVWDVVGPQFAKKNSVAIHCYLPRTPLYRAELSLTQEFVLGKETFHHAVSVENMLGEPVPVNIGIHNYWATPAGWEETSLNGEIVGEKVKENGFSAVQEENMIIFPGGKKYQWRLGGFNDAVLWSGRKEGRYDNAYVCIEPAIRYSPTYFGSAASMLPSGKRAAVTQEIKPV